jgi:hypothetical protein
MSSPCKITTGEWASFHNWTARYRRNRLAIGHVRARLADEFDRRALASQAQGLPVSLFAKLRLP